MHWQRRRVSDRAHRVRLGRHFLDALVALGLPAVYQVDLAGVALRAAFEEQLVFGDADAVHVAACGEVVESVDDEVELGEEGKAECGGFDVVVVRGDFGGGGEGTGAGFGDLLMFLSFGFFGVKWLFGVVFDFGFYVFKILSIFTIFNCFLMFFKLLKVFVLFYLNLLFLMPF